MRVDSKYLSFLDAILYSIRKELDRLYWNKHQREMVSPFDNSGAPEFSNGTFTVRSYNWDTEDEESKLPNFEYKSLKVWWYKYQGRGTCASADVKVNPNFIYQMYTDCMKSLASLEVCEED